MGTGSWPGQLFTDQGRSPSQRHRSRPCAHMRGGNGVATWEVALGGLASVLLLAVRGAGWGPTGTTLPGPREVRGGLALPHADAWLSQRAVDDAQDGLKATALQQRAVIPLDDVH